ncbi:MAG TPA: hypothetical protein VGS05_16835 [Candidatus Sulfotelmatobacter sp.]|nr:hypothetical protein [Candidatus Sulfotelmatobacter sp.]
MKKYKIDRIISIATLVASLIAIVLVLKKPTPVAQPLPAAKIAEHAHSFDQKMTEFEQATQQSSPSPASDSGQSSSSSISDSPKPEVHINSEEITAVLAQSLGNAGQLTPDSNVGSGAPTIKDQQVSFDGDVVHGQFLTEIAGKDVWVTISGHIGEKDGYATFDPTEFKVGDLSVPVTLVNPALQKKLAEQRDRLKLPENVGAMKVQNGELVMQGR